MAKVKKTKLFLKYFLYLHVQSLFQEEKREIHIYSLNNNSPMESGISIQPAAYIPAVTLHLRWYSIHIDISVSRPSIFMNHIVTSTFQVSDTFTNTGKH